MPQFGRQTQAAAIRETQSHPVAGTAPHTVYQPQPVYQQPQANPPYTPTTHVHSGPHHSVPVHHNAAAQPVLVRPTAPQPVLVRPVAPRPAPAIARRQPATKNPTRTHKTGPKGKVRLVNGLAVAPPDAPAVVKRAVAAGNRLQKMPYKWGGGHAKLNDDGYDCSGTVSYVLREAGLMKSQMTSRGFFNYGEPGKGDWITVWTRDGHVFMVIGGLRLDTGGSTTRTGPRWKTKSRSYKNLKPRHPAGL